MKATMMISSYSSMRKNDTTWTTALFLLLLLLFAIDDTVLLDNQASAVVKRVEASLSPSSSSRYSSRSRRRQYSPYYDDDDFYEYDFDDESYSQLDDYEDQDDDTDHVYNNGYSSSSSDISSENTILGLTEDEGFDDLAIDGEDNEETERILLALERTEQEEGTNRSRRPKTKQPTKKRRRGAVQQQQQASQQETPNQQSEKRKRRKVRSSNKKPTQNPNAALATKKKAEEREQFKSKITPETTKRSTVMEQQQTSSSVESFKQPKASAPSRVTPAQQNSTTPRRPTATIPSVRPNKRPTNRMPASSSSARRQQATATAASKAASTAAATTTPWIRKFLSRRAKDMLLPVPKDYIADNFNLAQLPAIVERIGFQSMGDDASTVAKALQEHRSALAAAAAANASVDGTTTTAKPRRSLSYPIYRRALKLILREDEAGEQEETESGLDEEEDEIIPFYAVQSAAEALYLMIHARFAMSPRGLEAIRHAMLINRTVFGKCPRPLCNGCATLPYGYSIDYTSTVVGSTTTNNDNVDSKAAISPSRPESRCHRYCPSCGEVWILWDSKTDGCAWGPSWCHLFLLAFGTQLYAEELAAVASKIAVSSAVAPPAVSPPPRSTVNARSGTLQTSTAPPPSVFGFRLHPATPFGRPFNEQSLRVSGGGSLPPPPGQSQ